MIRMGSGGLLRVQAQSLGLPLQLWEGGSSFIGLSSEVARAMNIEKGPSAVGKI